MKINPWHGIIILLLVVIVSAVSINNELSSLGDRVDGLNTNLFENSERYLNNKAFTENAKNVSESTALVEVRKDTFTFNQQVSGEVYLDENNQAWGMGTAFYIGDGIFLTASHVIAGTTPQNIRLTINGITYNQSVFVLKNDPNIDLGIIKTNITNLKSLKIISEERAPVGSKIGLIGYPFAKKQQILHDGIISSLEERDNGFFQYTINSFVNRGNSGGPVFLADTGDIIGITSQRFSEGIPIPIIDESKLTEGEKILLQLQIYMAVQLSQNSQSGVGQIVGINECVINNLKQSARQW